MSNYWNTQAVLDDVAMERYQQDQRWGEQNHLDGTISLFKEQADHARRIADRAAEAGTLTWLHILLEEVFEAAAETDEARLREELIQVAAVATGWVECIDRRAEQ